MTLGRQAELFDESGQAVFTPAVPRAGGRAAVAAAARRRRPRRGAADDCVGAARPGLDARGGGDDPRGGGARVAAVARTATAARGAVARHLVMSQSISSGKEESRWFSVPQRVLLPRYQLFEGADA
jgi:hypothetical protein